MPSDEAVSKGQRPNRAGKGHWLEDDKEDGASTEISEDEVDDEPNVQDLLSYLWSHDEDVVADAVEELSALTDVSHPERRSNRKQVFDAGGHSFLLMYTKKSIHKPNQAVLLQECFGILVDLCDHPKRCKAIAKHPDAIKVSWQTLSQFANDNPDVCGNVCCLISDLCDGAQSDDFKVGVFRKGFIPAVVKLMQQFPHDEYMQQVGISLLYQLLKSEKQYTQIRIALREADSEPVLQSAQKKFRHNAKIQKRAKSCLRQVSDNSLQVLMTNVINDLIHGCCSLQPEGEQEDDATSQPDDSNRRRQRSISPRPHHRSRSPNRR
eukprot:scaffold2182_cov198-Amphora_coffeaeformis.AAC.2